MVARPSLAVMVLLALGSTGAAYRTPNFVVEAPTPQIAQQVGQWAEYYRKQKANDWLGHEMPKWGQPCPLKVKVTMSGAGGATSFAFDQGRILSQEMQIEGSLDRLIKSVLPHEITHTVFAHYFRQPVPRWADEGGSVLSEDDVERNRHDVLVRQILNTPGRAIPLRRLFALTNYPPDVMVLYAEGFSVTNFLVGQSSRGAFLTFVAHGLRGNWDAAARQHYGYRSVEELEQAWLQHLRNGRRPPATVASAGGRPGAPATPTGRVVVRQTVPPSQPLLGAPQPVYRGVSATEQDELPAAPRPALDRPSAPSAAPARPPFMPPAPSYATPQPAPPSGFMPPPPPPARLLAPQFVPSGAGASLGQPTGSPVGYSP